MRISDWSSDVCSSDLYGAGFTDAQWTQMQTLYPDGVCDFSKPGVSQQKTIPWLSYQDRNGNVIYGGTPLPAASVNDGIGWTSPAFRSEEHTSELQSLMRISYAGFCLKKNKYNLVNNPYPLFTTAKQTT